MDEVQPLQIFVRNDKGKVWGPLAPASVELLFDNGVIDGKVQLSLDGANYVYPGRLPVVRSFIPRPLWGEVVVPGDDLEHPPPPPPIPGEMSGAQAVAATAVGAGGLRAGPGALANANVRNVAAMAGPGTRAAMDKRVVRNTGPPPAKPPSLSPEGGEGRGEGPVAAPSRPPPSQAAQQAQQAQQAQPRPAPKAAPQAQPRPPPASAPSPVAMPVSVGDGAIPASGDLAQLPVLHLYYLAASTDRTGLLTLELPDRKIDIHFRKGNPEHVDSTHPDDALATFLVRAQLASFEQLGQAEAEKGKYGGELVGALFGLGVLNPSTAFTHLATRANNILMKAFVANAGKFRFEAKDLAPHKAMPLGNRWSVLAEQVRRVPGHEIKRRLTDVADCPVMKSGGRVAFDQLRLTPHEARALSYFDGVHSLAQLAGAHPAEADHLFRVAWMLKDLEAVSFAAVKLAPPPPEPEPPLLDAEPIVEAEVEPIVDAEPAPPPARAPAAPGRPGPPVAKPAGAPPPGPPRPAGSPGRPPPPVIQASKAPGPPPKLAQAPAAPARPPPAAAAPVYAGHSGDFDGELRQLQELLKKMKEQDYFQVLGLTPKTDPGAIKMAYFKLAKIYHPDTVPPGAPEAYARAKADVFARIGEANRTLVDEKARTEYIAELEAGGHGEKIDVASILAAEELFQKGMIMVKARKFPEAVKMLDEAIKANAEEGEFYSYRGYARFFLNPDRKVSYAEAMKDINICLKKNERCASVHFHQGMMTKLLGDMNAAKKHFQRTVQLQPDHIDAQRELRLMK